MAAFNINCPHCGEALEVQDEWAKMETACPFCEKAFIIPSRATPPLGQGRQATPPPPPPVQSCEDDYSQSGEEPEARYVASSYTEMEEETESNIFLRFFSIRGRSPRREMWIFLLVVGLADWLLASTSGNTLSFFLFCTSLVVGIPLSIRRLHDVGSSGWFLLTVLIGNILVPFYLLFSPSQPEENQWGPCP